MADTNPISFKGTSPEECEDFVAAIRRRAFDEGKHRDNEWMAGLASTCFVRDAFYWYEELDEDVKNDWSRLRPALVARFGRGGPTSTTSPGASSTPTLAPFTTIPTPAAAPPPVVPRSSVRKGHLKVISSNGSILGYLPKQPDQSGLYSTLSSTPTDALLVLLSVLSADEVFEIQIINASQNPQTCDMLAISWYGLRGNEWMDGTWSKTRCCSFSTVTSRFDWAIERKVWKMSKEGELSVEYPKPGGGTEGLHCSVDLGVRFHKLVPDESDRGRIVFEDIL